MAVVKSGDETIVRYSRGLVFTYYSLVVGSGVIAALSLMVAIGAVIEPGQWLDKLVSAGAGTLGTLAFAITAAQMYTAGHAYSRTYVAISAEGLRFQLPRADGDLLAIGNERRFAWSEIDGITYEHNLRRRVCSFTAGKDDYTLTQNNCPSPGSVAQLMAERKGVPLAAPRAAE